MDNHNGIIYTNGVEASHDRIHLCEQVDDVENAKNKHSWLPSFKSQRLLKNTAKVSTTLMS